jgi:lysozyme
MNEELTTSQKGIDLIKHFEGLFLQAYLCPAKVWTIGYGHTGLKHKDGTVKRGRVITEKEAETLLKHDLSKFENAVKKCVRVPLAQHEFDALVSFHFNTGGLEKSTLLKCLNSERRHDAAMEFYRWVRAGRKILPGLERRRRAEAMMFAGVEPDFQ